MASSSSSWERKERSPTLFEGEGSLAFTYSLFDPIMRLISGHAVRLTISTIPDYQVSPFTYVLHFIFSILFSAFKFLHICIPI